MAEENNPAPANAPEEKNQDWTDMIEVRDRGNAASVSGDGDSKILNQEASEESKKAPTTKACPYC